MINPRSLQGQTFGGVMLGIGHAIAQKWVYDQHYGVPLAKRFHYNKPPTILDAPSEIKFAAVDLPDPETPVGARGIGEPPVGAGYGAVMNAIAAAVGDEVFRRSPVTADMILTALENGAAHARGADGAHLSRDLGCRTLRHRAIQTMAVGPEPQLEPVTGALIWL